VFLPFPFRKARRVEVRGPNRPFQSAAWSETGEVVSKEGVQVVVVEPQPKVQTSKNDSRRSKGLGGRGRIDALKASQKSISSGESNRREEPVSKNGGPMPGPATKSRAGIPTAMVRPQRTRAGAATAGWRALHEIVDAGGECLFE
jgi:hypothetical protein